MKGATPEQIFPDKTAAHGRDHSEREEEREKEGVAEKPLCTDHVPLWHWEGEEELGVKVSL